MELFKSLLGEAFSSLRQHQIVISNAEFFLPAGIEQRRVDGGHTGFIGISFSGHIQTASTRSRYQPNAIERLRQATAVDMDDVQGSAGDCGRSNDLTDGLDAGSGLMLTATAKMG